MLSKGLRKVIDNKKGKRANYSSPTTRFWEAEKRSNKDEVRAVHTRFASELLVYYKQASKSTGLASNTMLGENKPLR